MFAAVPRIWPKLVGAATFELPHDALGLPHSTWFGALNISMRNWSACRSAIRKSLIVGKSMFTWCGPFRLLRAQVPYCPATVLLKAAGLRYAFAVGLGST